MYIVFIRNLQLYAYHGVPDEEQRLGHRYQITVEMLVRGSADESDDVSGTVDYGEVTQLLLTRARETQFRTVEALAQYLGGEVLQAYPDVQRLEIEVAKLNPPTEAVVEAAGVRIELSR